MNKKIQFLITFLIINFSFLHSLDLDHMVLVPSGTISIKESSEIDAHKAEIESFYIGKTEISWELWKKVYIWSTGDQNIDGMINNNEKKANYSFENVGKSGSSDEEKANYPVTSVSWRDAIIFCNALTEYYNSQNIETKLTTVYNVNGKPIKSSKDSNSETIDNIEQNLNATGFRLPTLDEWEYAARYIKTNKLNNGNNVSGDRSGVSGKSEGFFPFAEIDNFINTITFNRSNKVNTFSWNENNSNDQAQEISQKKPNHLGIYDMSGNVAEWCFDLQVLWDQKMRWYRGGHWNSSYWDLRVSFKNFTPAFKTIHYIGFRIVRNAQFDK